MIRLRKQGKDMLRRVFVSGNAGYFHNEQDGESWEGRKRSLDALKRYGFVRMSVTKEHPPRRLWHLTAAGNKLAQDYWCPEADSPPAAEGAVQHG